MASVSYKKRRKQSNFKTREVINEGSVLLMFSPDLGFVSNPVMENFSRDDCSSLKGDRLTVTCGTSPHDERSERNMKVCEGC